jgi:hypothetical protein
MDTAFNVEIAAIAGYAAEVGILADVREGVAAVCLAPRQAWSPMRSGMPIASDAKPLGEVATVLPTECGDVVEDDEGLDHVAAERQQLLLAYKADGKRQGIKITDLMIAEAAKPGKWNTRFPVAWWKSNKKDENGNRLIGPREDAAIRRVLTDRPHLKKRAQ